VSHTACIRFAPIFTHERLNDPSWNRAGRMLFERLKLAQDTVPFIVDHEREVGTVHELFRLDWTDGPWIAARATVTDPPGWLRRGAKASFEFTALHRRELSLPGVEAEVIASGLVTEVSVLSPATQPAEPCAEVVSYRVANADHAAGGELIHTPRVLIRRNIGRVTGVSLGAGGWLEFEER
jgi:hypothetical protein